MILVFYTSTLHGSTYSYRKGLQVTHGIRFFSNALTEQIDGACSRVSLSFSRDSLWKPFPEIY
jgi:hypothetical protein